MKKLIKTLDPKVRRRRPHQSRKPLKIPQPRFDAVAYAAALEVLG